MGSPGLIDLELLQEVTMAVALRLEADASESA
jgi:hypothetical protein